METINNNTPNTNGAIDGRFLEEWLEFLPPFHLYSIFSPKVPVYANFVMYFSTAAPEFPLSAIFGTIFFSLEIETAYFNVYGGQILLYFVQYITRYRAPNTSRYFLITRYIKEAKLNQEKPF